MLCSGLHFNDECFVEVIFDWLFDEDITYEEEATLLQVVYTNEEQTFSPECFVLLTRFTTI
jgi:hypothetical protein